MTFRETVRIGDTVDQPDETLSLLKNGVGVYDLYVIYFSQNNGALLEMAESTRLLSQPLTQKNAEIIAIANGRTEALALITALVSENLDVIQRTAAFKKRLSGERS
ncbi:MAG: hypothetical protein LBU77_02180 [Clostridiales bacterium]|nr:hypothetical protein [Clostridiales bacterium]